jgi:hypothetical protein
MDDRLVEIARYASPNNAAVARNALDAAGIPAFLDGDAMATWFWHFGSALGGVKLFVRSTDASEALAVLCGKADDALVAPADDRCPCGGDLAQPESEEEVQRFSSPTLRAWRAAIIGILLLPPLLSLYSIWLIVRHGLLRSRPLNWKATAALGVDLVVIGFVGTLVGMIALSGSESPQEFPPGSEPLCIKHIVTIPLVPNDSVSIVEGGGVDSPGEPPAERKAEAEAERP